jgi:hypothetical protein
MRQSIHDVLGNIPPQVDKSRVIALGKLRDVRAMGLRVISSDSSFTPL